MKVNVLRLDHRLKKGHSYYNSCMFNSPCIWSSKIYLAGERDNKLMENVRDTSSRWGGNFEIEYTDSSHGRHQ